jgi:DNA-binding beta-propeller fold protein YncE
MRRPLTAIAVIAGLLALAALPAAASTPVIKGTAGTEEVLFVGNNWDGTATIADPLRFKAIKRIDIVPDIGERRAEIFANPVATGFFLGVRALIGEGNDQLVDDMFSSPDGKTVYVSRPSLVDVVAIDLGTGKLKWRTKIEGYRSDHMAISPDGKRVLVSASTAKKVHSIDTATGKIVGEFASGDQPHENNYSKNGKLIYHASIGTVYTPTDDPSLDATKGRRVFQVVDAATLRILKVIDVGEALEAAGHPGFSSAVRPMALSPDERYVYMQLSFHHGFVEFDLATDKPTRIAHLPLSAKAKTLRRDEYVLDSAHHGLAMNPDGTKLCAAGTMSDYAAIVSRSTFAHKIVPVGDKPYWSTNSGDGRNCFVSVSGEDRVAVVSYGAEREIASIPVGDHPQRMRLGPMRSDYLPGDRVAPVLTKVKLVRRGARRWLRLRVSERARVTVAVTRRNKRGRFVRVRTVRRTLKAGSRRMALGKFAGGRYRLTVRASDATGNISPRQVRRFRG